MAKYDFFISYSSKDKDIAFKIVTAIESAGYTCWIAPRNIPYGTPYASAIMEGIDECDKFIVLITKKSIQSNDVLNEVDNAHSVKKTIIPVRLTETPLSRELNYYLSRTQWLTLPSTKPEEIVKLLNIEVAPITPAPISPISRNKLLVYIIAAIIAIGVGGTIWLCSFDKSNDNDEISLLTNEKLQEKDGKSNSDSIKSDEDVFNKNNDNKTFPSNSSVIDEKSHSGTAKTLATSKNYEKLLIDANTYYNAKDYKKTLLLYEDIANNFDINYADKVGYMYYNGLGTEKNPSKGIDWGKKAADNGNHDAQIRVGYMLLRAEQYKEAAKYYHEAEKYVVLDPETNNDMGYLYFNGLGVTKNVQLAKKYWESAGNSGVVNAQVALGNMYYTGEGVEQNYKEAYKWYSKAANQGELNSIYAIAFMYESGLGIEKT